MRAIYHTEETLAHRLKWLCFFRLSISVLAIGVILVLEARLSAIPKTYVASYYTLIFACLVNLIYVPFIKGARFLKILAIIQLIVDVVTETLLVYFTGIDKVFAYLYFSTVIASSMLLMPQSSYVFASISSVMLSGVLLAYFFADTEGFELPLVDPAIKMAMVAKINFLLPYIFFFALSLYMVAFLSCKLAEETGRIRILSQEILQNMTDGVIAVSRQGKIEYINQRAKEFLGLVQKDLKGQDYSILPKEVSDAIYFSLKENQRRTIEIYCDVPLKLITTTIVDKRKSIRGVIAIFNDISDIKKIEEMKSHEERFNTIHELSVGIAHEIRNPLASIRGASQELEKLKSPSAKEDKLINILKRESDRLNKILTDFLEFAKDKSSEKFLFDISEIVLEVVDLIKARADKNVVIDTNLKNKLLCKCLPDRLRQALLNIGLNALDAIDSKGKITITSKLVVNIEPMQGEKKWALVEITDNGIGMDDEIKRNLYIPFFTTKPNGTGMGLAIAKRIVDEHQGHIVIFSEKGKGTKCSIFLPTGQ